jgi:avermectin B 5-O-methyltransferase
MGIESILSNSEVVGRHYDGASADACRVLGGPRHQYHVGLFDATLDLRRAQDRLTEEVGERLGALGSARILDVGCGVAGPACTLAHRYGWNIAGVTVSRVQVAEARGVIAALGCGTGQVRVLGADAHFLPFRSNTFDGAYAIESLAHFIDRGRAISECARVLRRGGRLALWDLVAGEACRSAFAMLHLGSLDDYIELCQLAGFEVLYAKDRAAEVLPRTLEHFKLLLDPLVHAATLRCCADFLAAFESGDLGYALVVAQLTRKP